MNADLTRRRKQARRLIRLAADVERMISLLPRSQSKTYVGARADVLNCVRRAQSNHHLLNLFVSFGTRS
jgi:hypothetical protein